MTSVSHTANAGGARDLDYAWGEWEPPGLDERDRFYRAPSSSPSAFAFRMVRRRSLHAQSSDVVQTMTMVETLILQEVDGVRVIADVDVDPIYRTFEQYIAS